MGCDEWGVVSADAGGAFFNCVQCIIFSRWDESCVGVSLEGHSSIVFSLSFSPDGTKVASFSESKAVGCDERGIYHAPFTLNVCGIVKGESSEMEIKSKKDAKVSIMQMRLARGTKGFVSSARKHQDQKMKFWMGKH